MSTGRVLRLLARLIGVVPADQAHECMYGKTATAAYNCTRSVPESKACASRRRFAAGLTAPPRRSGA